MAVQTRTTLAGFFNTGDKPTETQFGHLIDSSFNLNDGGTVNAACDIALAGLGTLKGNLKEVILESADDNEAITLTAAQSGATIVFDEGTTYTVTLPAVTAAQVGTHYTFVQTVALTSTKSNIIQASADDDLLGGGLNLSFDAAKTDGSTGGLAFIPAAAASHKITLDDDEANGAGGPGSIIHCVAIAASTGTSGGTDDIVWVVSGTVVAQAENSNGSAIFSDT